MKEQDKASRARFGGTGKGQAFLDNPLRALNSITDASSGALYTQQFKGRSPTWGEYPGYLYRGLTNSGIDNPFDQSKVDRLATAFREAVAKTGKDVSQRTMDEIERVFREITSAAEIGAPIKASAEDIRLSFREVMEALQKQGVKAKDASDPEKELKKAMDSKLRFGISQSADSAGDAIGGALANAVDRIRERTINQFNDSFPIPGMVV